MTSKTEHLSSNFTLKFHKCNNPDELNFLIFLLFRAPLIFAHQSVRNKGLFRAPLIFAQNRCAKIEGIKVFVITYHPITNTQLIL